MEGLRGVKGISGLMGKDGRKGFIGRPGLQGNLFKIKYLFIYWQYKGLTGGKRFLNLSRLLGLITKNLQCV